MCQKIRLSPRLPPKLILKSVWQVQQESIRRSVADHVTMTPEVGLRFQGVPHEELQQDEDNSLKRYIGRLMHERHPNKDALTAELQSNFPYTPFNEESTQMIHTQGNVEGLELYQISDKNQYPHCMKCWMEGIVATFRSQDQLCKLENCGWCPVSRPTVAPFELFVRISLKGKTDSHVCDGGA